MLRDKTRLWNILWPKTLQGQKCKIKVWENHKIPERVYGCEVGGMGPGWATLGAARSAGKGEVLSQGAGTRGSVLVPGFIIHT